MLHKYNVLIKLCFSVLCCSHGDINVMNIEFCNWRQNKITNLSGNISSSRLFIIETTHNH